MTTRNGKPRPRNAGARVPLPDKTRRARELVRNQDPVAGIITSSFHGIDDFTEPAELIDSVEFERVIVQRAPSELELGGDQLIEIADDEPPDPAEAGTRLGHFHTRRMALAVFEGPTQLVAAKGAIEGAGHAVARAGTGRAGIDEIIQLITNGSIDAILVALPGGEPIIDAALALGSRRPVVIASCAGEVRDAIARTASAGADLVAMRPHDAERLAPILVAAARLGDERNAPPPARDGETILRTRLEQLATSEVASFQPFDLFQRIFEIELKRSRRYSYPLSVALFVVEVAATAPPGIPGILRARAGNALIHTIRDIDLATELDQQRFLVLLPYTDLSGAADVGRRIVAAVAANDPVVAAGRSYPCCVTGAVAGARPNLPLSFARLMKDATRTLEQAREDGVSLAVQP